MMQGLMMGMCALGCIFLEDDIPKALCLIAASIWGVAWTIHNKKP